MRQAIGAQWKPSVQGHWLISQGLARQSLVFGLAVGLLAAVSGGATAAEVPRIQGELTVFAAASLSDVFQEMAAQIEQANPGTKLSFNFAGSPTLRTQLAQGARADVFAAADEPNMDRAKSDGTISGEAQIFARNLLVVVVPANNPAGITTLQDLAKAKLKLILTNKDVPVGSYARQALAKMSQDPAFGKDFSARVLANLVSEETNVRQVASKVQLGEADAGIVYSTDVTPAMRPAVKVIPIQPEFNVVAEYPIALVKGARNESAARAFIAYVLSPVGQAILARHGFLVAGSYAADEALAPDPDAASSWIAGEARWSGSLMNSRSHR